MLLKLPSSDTHTLTPLVEILLSHYDSSKNVFIFGSHRLRITLEDVLFITGLPISGKPVLCSKSCDTDAFRRIFGLESNEKSLTLTELKHYYAANKGLDNDKRMIAVLLYLISCFITPTSDGGRNVTTTYVEFVENLGEVDSYAWGAALLAFLYTGIKKWKDYQSCWKTMLSIDGNFWLLLCFFFIRIPKLMPAIGVEMDWIVDKVTIKQKKHKQTYKENVVNILNNLSDEDIKWLPYDSSCLPPRLKDQYRFRALVAPLFCNNYVVHHGPQLVLKQFGFSEESVAGFERYDYEIKMKQNKGPVKPDYLTLYKKEIELWEEGKQLQDFISRKRSADVTEASSPPKKKSISVEVSRELAEKLGTDLSRHSKEENEQKIRSLESKIKNSEAREEKLNSEMRAARERNGKIEGEIKSSEDREKKLKSELSAALERNGKLEGMIESSEALEKKLISEAIAARERNVKLQGEIKKLKSEVRANRERIVKLEGVMKHAASLLANSVKKSEEAQDDDSAVHEARGDKEELHSEKHMVVEKTELKSKTVGKGSHEKDSTSGKPAKIFLVEYQRKKLNISNMSGKGESVKAAEKQSSREEMESVVADILKEVDFNTDYTEILSHILEKLGMHFGGDLMHRRAEVEELVNEIIGNMLGDEVGELRDIKPICPII